MLSCRRAARIQTCWCRAAHSSTVMYGALAALSMHCVRIEQVVLALLGFRPLPFEADPSLWVLFHDPQASTSFKTDTDVQALLNMAGTAATSCS